MSVSHASFFVHWTGYDGPEIFTFVSSCPWLIFEFWTIDVCYEFSLYTLFLRDNEMVVFLT